MQILQLPISRMAACVVVFFVCFALIGTTLSQHLFFWNTFSYTAQYSKTVLWCIYFAFLAVACVIVFFCTSSIIESVLIGVLLSAAAGGAYCIGYFQPVVAAIVAIVVFGVVLVICRGVLARFSIVRALYIGVGIGLAISLGSFLVNANSMHEVRSLSGLSSGVSTTTEETKITNAQWALMNASQREKYLAGVVSLEAQRLDLGDVSVSTCILPENVPATVDSSGRVLLNFAAIRVACPSPSDVLEFETKNEISWTYEELTSPSDIVLATCHALAHVYEQKRVSGEITEQRTWPYEDAPETDSSNAVLDEWSASLPIDPKTDDGSSRASETSLLESQAWGYAYTRLKSYVET